MKKRKPIAFALILVIAGAVVFLAGLILNGSAPSPLLKAEENTYVIDEPFTDIKIDMGSADIAIEKTDGEARVETRVYGALKPEIRVKDGVLTVSTDERPHFGLHLFTDRITVYLPGGSCESADIELSSGSVTVSGVSFAGHLDAEATSGSIRLSGVSCGGKLEAETTSGSIRLDGVSCEGDLKAETTSGSIHLSDISCGGKLEAETTSGSIRLSGVSCEGDLKAETTSGSISLSAFSTPGNAALTVTSGSVSVKELTAAHLNAKTTSGSIRLDRCDAKTLNLKTTSGSVKGSIVGSRVFVCSSTSGSIHVPETAEGGKCVIKTGSGSIDIEISMPR